MKSLNEYQIKAEKFLSDTGTKMTAKFLKHDTYFDGDKEKRDIYEITLKRGAREYVFNYGQSINNSGEFILLDYDLIKENCQSDKIHSHKDLIDFKKRTRNVYAGSYKRNEHFSQPNAYDVLACLTKYDPGSFEDFCGSYDYDTDSKKAEQLYNRVVDEYKNVKMLFSDEEIEKMKEIE